MFRRTLLAGGCLVAAAFPAAAMAAPGALYTQTNNPAGNVVQKFDRAADGSLTAVGTFSTGGSGLAGLGGRQGAVALSGDEAFVLAVNAGSNTVSTFRVTDDGLALIGSVSSGGVAPDSVDERDGHVYVLNSGGTPNVTTFALGADGTLTQQASQPLAGGAQGAAQVTAAPDGSALVVTERLSNRIETLPLDGSGIPGAPSVTASNGNVPFGFAWGHRGQLIVSEAAASGVSSYGLVDGGLFSITASLPVGHGAACWVATSPNGRYAYTGNASGSISGFAVGTDGALSELDTVSVAAPRDLDFARNGRFLYVVSPGAAGASSGRVTGYRVATDGTLTAVTSVAAAAGLTGAAAA